MFLFSPFFGIRRASEQGYADGGFAKAKPCVLRCSSFSPKSLRLFGDPIVYTPIIPKKRASTPNLLSRCSDGTLLYMKTYLAQNKSEKLFF